LLALVLLEAGRAVVVVVVVLEVVELVAGRVVVVVLEVVEVLEAGRVVEVRAALCCAFW